MNLPRIASLILNPLLLGIRASFLICGVAVSLLVAYAVVETAIHIQDLLARVVFDEPWFSN